MTNLQQLEKRIRELVPSLVKILGHPIFLHHVLQAINLQLHKPIFVVIGQNGQFKVMELHTGEEKLISEYWDLTLPLSGQSEETVNFLLELIK